MTDYRECVVGMIIAIAVTFAFGIGLGVKGVELIQCTGTKDHSTGKCAEKSVEIPNFVQ